jgi:accessory gene regulator protein AgrB
MNYYNEHETKRNKLIAYILSILTFLVPMFLILLFPTFGVIMLLSTIVIYTLWNPVFVKLAKLIYKFIFKEEMEKK